MADDTGAPIEVDPRRLHELLRLAHAITYQAAQGRSLEGTVCLAECSHPMFTAKHLKVGLSRARDTDLIAPCF